MSGVSPSPARAGQQSPQSAEAPPSPSGQGVVQRSPAGGGYAQQSAALAPGGATSDPLGGGGGYAQQSAALSPAGQVVQMSPRRTPGSNPELDYFTDRDSPRHDPEEVRDPNARLPYRGRNGWDARRILTTLSQIDSDDTTQTDLVRCAVTSFLAIHINSGPGAVASVAINTVNAFADYFRAHNRNWSAPERERNTVLLRDLAQGSGRLSVHQGTYRDLQHLANGMKIVVPSGEHGATVNSDYETLGSLGGAMSEMNTSYSGLDGLEGLLGQIGEHRNNACIVGINQHEGEVEGVNHAIVLGCDPSGRVYLYDPWPRRGSQILYWPSARRDIEDYFQSRDGTNRPWVVKQWVVGEPNRARAAARG